MWRNSHTILVNTQKVATLFFQNSRRLQHDSPHTNIPLISPLLSHRLLGKSQFLSNVDEETILELLQSISDIPVAKSEFEFVNFKDLPHAKWLPNLPNELNDESILNYAHNLTRFQYNRNDTPKISEALSELINYSPALFTKKEYLDIISFFHHVSNDKTGLKILNIMLESTEIKQDIDFDNILLSRAIRPSMYRQKLERLETLKDKGWKANCNTWYSIFHMFRNPEPQVQLLDLMEEYQVPTMPILKSLSSIVNYLTPERLLSIYEENGITLENKQMDSILFNQLIACYLKDDRINEAWNLITNQKTPKQFINQGLFVTFTNHFFKNNQLGFAFAFSNFIQKNYRVNTRQILRSMLINVYLKDCPYFDYWVSLVRDIYPDIKNNKTFVNTKTISNLNDYCDLHNIRENLEVMEKKDKEIMKSIVSNLVWKNRPNFQLSKNAPKFIELANALGQTE